MCLKNVQLVGKMILGGISNCTIITHHVNKGHYYQLMVDVVGIWGQFLHQLAFFVHHFLPSPPLSALLYHPLGSPLCDQSHPHGLNISMSHVAKSWIATSRPKGVILISPRPPSPSTCFPSSPPFLPPSAYNWQAYSQRPQLSIPHGLIALHRNPYRPCP